MRTLGLAMRATHRGLAFATDDWKYYALDEEYGEVMRQLKAHLTDLRALVVSPPLWFQEFVSHKLRKNISTRRWDGSYFYAKETDHYHLNAPAGCKRKMAAWFARLMGLAIMQVSFQNHGLHRTVKGFQIAHPLVQVAGELNLTQEDIEQVTAEREAAIKRNKDLAKKEREQKTQEDYPENHKQARRQGKEGGRQRRNPE